MQILFNQIRGGYSLVLLAIISYAIFNNHRMSFYSYSALHETDVSKQLCGNKHENNSDI